MADPRQAQAGDADAGQGAAIRGCQVYFRHPVLAPFTLEGPARVTFWVYCDAPTTAAVGTPFAVILTNMVEINSNDENTVFVDAPLNCPQDPLKLDAVIPEEKFPHDFAPGDTLTLVISNGYLNPRSDVAAIVHIVTGGADPSRLEVQGLPGPQAAGGPPPVMSRLAWTAEVSEAGPSGGKCLTDEAPVYAMRPDPPGAVVEPGKAYSIVSAVAYSCRTFFVYTAQEPFTLSGTARIMFWYACDRETYGQEGFQLHLQRNLEEIAPMSPTYLSGPAACPLDAMSPMFVEMTLREPTEFQPGDELLLTVSQFNLVGPRAVDPNFHYLVGGDAVDGTGALVCCRSSLAIEGLPWDPVELYGVRSPAELAPPPADLQPQETAAPQRESPGAQAALILPLALALAAWRARRIG